MLKNDRGFAALEIILVIVVLALVGYAGYRAWQTHQKASQSQPTSQTKASTTAVKDPYSGWKTYMISDNLMFKYPADWTLDTSNAQYPSLKSPTDNQSSLQYQLTYGPPYNRKDIYNDTVASNLNLGISLAKPLYLLALDFNSSSGKDIEGLFLSDTNSASGASVTSSFVGFAPRSGASIAGFEAVLQPPHYQNNGGEPLATYQNNQYYQTVVKIFQSLKSN